MSSSHPNNNVKDAVSQVDRVVDAIEERGFDDISEECDDYSVLLERFEFRKLVTFELYEGYFPPRRHEFELQILTSLIDAVASSKPATFLFGAAVSGAVGNFVYDMLKKALAHIVRRLKTTRRSRDAFCEIEKTLDGIRTYFQIHDHARTDEVCAALDLEPYKVEPLLKLLGFRCNRRGKRQVWTRPRASAH